MKKFALDNPKLLPNHRDPTTSFVLPAHCTQMPYRIIAMQPPHSLRGIVAPNLHSPLEATDTMHRRAFHNSDVAHYDNGNDAITLIGANR